MEPVTVIIRLLLATLLGAAVGFEREYFGKSAGLRTHALVCMASTLMTIVSIYISKCSGSDPGRIAAQVITGIGFIGAGTILRAGASVKGLTTAATLWTVAGIGLAVGVGEYLAAAFATGITFIVLLFFSMFERKIGKEQK